MIDVSSDLAPEVVKHPWSRSPLSRKWKLKPVMATNTELLDYLAKEARRKNQTRKQRAR